MKKQSFILFVFFIVGGVIVVEISSLAQFGAMVWPFPVSCTLGITGTAANVTLSGFGANLACSKGVQQYTSVLYSSSNPAGNEMCEGDIKADGIPVHYLVRDSGVLNLVGNYLCSQLSKGMLPDAPTPTPTPTPVTPTPVINDLAPTVPFAIDVANRMQSLDSDIYKVITDTSPGGGATITSPWTPGHGTAMFASYQYGWYTIEAFNTAVDAYQDYEASQSMTAILQNTCILIGPTPPQPMLLAFEQSCA